MRAAIEPKTVVVQGLGGVGKPLAEALKGAGVRVIASDVRPVEGFESVPPDDVYGVECDVFAPCAMGGVLTPEIIDRLKCKVVCGGANNPLASDEAADRLHKRGILYVPDFLSNAGATVKGASTSVGEEDQIDARMTAIGDLVREVSERSKKEDRSPHHVAVEMADQRIESQK